MAAGIKITLDGGARRRSMATWKLLPQASMASSSSGLASRSHTSIISNRSRGLDQLGLDQLGLDHLVRMAGTAGRAARASQTSRYGRRRGPH